MAVARLDEDEVSSTDITDGLGRVQEMTIVNEPGLYSLILGSRKPEAKAFKRWVTHDVLPSIQKTGSYQVPQLDERKLRMELLKSAVDHEERLIGIEQRIEVVEQSTTLDHGEQERVRKAVARRVCAMTEDGATKKGYFRQLHNEIKSRWAVPSYRDVLRIELDEVLHYIAAWKPRIV